MSDFDLVQANQSREIGSKVLNVNGDEVNFSKLLSVTEHNIKYMIIYKMCGKTKINVVEIDKESTNVVNLTEEEISVMYQSII